MLLVKKIKGMLESGATLEEISVELGVSIDWLECVINAESFKLI